MPEALFFPSREDIQPYRLKRGFPRFPNWYSLTAVNALDASFWAVRLSR
jgi:hypothetical protein